MDYRYVVIGLNIIVLSGGFIIISLIQGLEILLGISFSALILGIVILFIGLTYVEPLDKLYRASYRVISILFTKVLEDTNLIYGATIRTCLSDSNLLLLGQKGISCEEVYPGIGVVKGRAFIAVPLSMIVPIEVSGEETIDEYGLESIIRERIVSMYNLCRDVRVEKKENTLRITFYGLRKEVLDLIRKPINPLKFLVLGIVSLSLRREVVFRNEEVIEDNYVQEITVV